MIWLPSKNGGKNPAEYPAETAHLAPSAAHDNEHAWNKEKPPCEDRSRRTA